MKKFLILLIVAAVVVASWLYFRKSNASAAPDETVRPTARVQTVTLKKRSIVRGLDVLGVVVAAPSGEQALSATFDSIVRKVDVAPGAQVAAGDVLLEIAPTPETQLSLESARSVLDATKKSLVAARERYDLKLGTSDDLRAAEQTEREAQQKVDSLEKRGLGGNGEIIAPVAGVVSRVEVSAGSAVTAGTLLVTLTAETGLEARLGVEAGDSDQVRPGQTVTLHSAHRSSLPLATATVRLVGRSLDATSGSVEVRVPLPTVSGLMLGERVSAVIELLKKEALVVPRSAVLPDGDKRVLFTVKDGHAVRHEVTVGIVANDLMEVSGSNLHEGDSVVVLGNYELENGMATEPMGAGKKPEEIQP